MLKHFAVLVICVYGSSLCAVAQGENNIWCFGFQLGLDFSTNAPTQFKHNMKCSEGSTSVADEQGNLLFYTIGFKVWDRNGNVMPNSIGLMGNCASRGINSTGSSENGVVAVRFPHDKTKYYLFSAQCAEEGMKSVYYSIIDMTLNQGLGDIVPGQKNIVLHSDYHAEHLNVAPKDDCAGYWLVVQSSQFFTPFQNHLYAYEISASGVAQNPVVTSYPPGHGDGRIAFLNNFQNCVITGTTTGKALTTASFDRNTGIFSNFSLMDIDTLVSYRIAFSADESKLYTLCADVNRTISTILQFDFNLWPNIGAIANSRVSVGPIIDIYNLYDLYAGLRLAPDNKIYMAYFAGKYIGRINNPSNAGAACNFDPNAIDLITFDSLIYPPLEFGNPILLHPPADTFPQPPYYAAICDQNEITLSPKETYEYYSWHNGEITPTISVKDTGVYWVLGFKECNYYVDTFYVRDIPNDTFLVSAGDTIICLDLPFDLAPEGTYDEYSWNTGATSPHISVRSPGTYTRYGYRNCKVYTDSMKIDPLATDTLFYAVDSNLCFDNHILLAPPGQYDTYLWNTGSVQATITAYSAGIYIRAAYKHCTSRLDTFKITYTDYMLDLGPDSVLCDGTTLLLSIKEPGVTCWWQDGSTGPEYRVRQGGTYWVRTDKEGCILSDTVTFIAITPYLDLPYPDTTICHDQQLTIHASAYPESSYLWHNGINTSFIDVNGSGMYTVTATNICGTFRDSVRVTVEPCHCKAFIPNAFSPNGDGHNDVFKIELNCPAVTQYSMSIYNRFGQRVFLTENPLEHWDGMHQQRAAELGTYFYYLLYRDGSNNTFRHKGDLTLVR